MHWAYEHHIPVIFLYEVQQYLSLNQNTYYIHVYWNATYISVHLQYRALCSFLKLDSVSSVRKTLSRVQPSPLKTFPEL